MWRPYLGAALLWAIYVIAIPVGRAQETSSANEIPIERCDRLPVVRALIGKTEFRFLLDTGATTVLNLKSFSGGKTRDIEVTSWTGTAATSAREVSVKELSIGNHHLRGLKLPAIDLSPIGNACGGPIDGILGVDLLDKMEVSIDLKRQVASLGGEPVDPKAMYDEMEKSMGHCTQNFEHGKAQEFEQCLDPEIVLYTPDGEFRGRTQVMGYMQSRYFKFAPQLHYCMNVQDIQSFGNALWYSYEYELKTPEARRTGHGMAMCRKTDGRWRILNMHNSVATPAAEACP
jgi:SnoaL-like domain/Aspartyl protease